MTMAAAAVTLAASGQSAENLERARQAYNNYDFELAEELLKPTPVRKGKRTVAGTQTEEGSEMLRRVENTANFMQRVEKIEILDSPRSAASCVTARHSPHPVRMPKGWWIMCSPTKAATTRSGPNPIRSAH